MDTKKRKVEESAVEDENEDLSWLDLMSISELKVLAAERNVDYKNITEKGELVFQLKQKLEKDLLEGTLLYYIYIYIYLYLFLILLLIGIPIKRKKIGQRRDCPYLDTINR